MSLQIRRAPRSPARRPAARGGVPTAPGLAVALLALAATSCACRDEPAPGPRGLNIVLVVVDTLRADHLGAYGWSEASSPNVDQLARDGVLIERMVCTAPQTLPSFCSILTGTHPVSHGVRTNGMFALPSTARTLAETLRAEGYRTAAFLAGFPLDARFGLEQGFESYFDEMRSVRPMDGLQADAQGQRTWVGHELPEAFENTADVVTDEALAWLKRDDGRAFFLLVHYFDPHHGYAPPARFERFDSLYSGEVAFVDEQFGRLLTQLDALGRRDDTLVVFTADHGECLGEYGRHFHQGLLYEATLRVPCVLRLPGKLPAGARRAGTCSSVDIMPTLLELAGLPVPATVEGTSLVASIGAPPQQADVFFETMYGLLETDRATTRTGLVRGRWKLIRNRWRDAEARAERESVQLFDLELDRDELTDVAAQNPAVVETLLEGLRSFERSHHPGRADIVTPDRATLDKLKALGYL